LVPLGKSHVHQVAKKWSVFVSADQPQEFDGSSWNERLLHALRLVQIAGNLIDRGDQQSELFARSRISARLNWKGSPPIAKRDRFGYWQGRRFLVSQSLKRFVCCNITEDKKPHDDDT
jgi:hypothetical protein